MVEKTLDQIAGNDKDLREKMKDQARKNVASNLILYKIANVEKIESDPESSLDNEKVFQYLESLAAK